MSSKQYGFCPLCCAPVLPDGVGNHRCDHGHVYPKHLSTRLPRFGTSIYQAMRSIETAMASDALRTRLDLDELSDWCEAMAQTARQMELTA